MKLWQLVLLYKCGEVVLFKGEDNFIGSFHRTDDDKAPIIDDHLYPSLFYDHKDDEVAYFRVNLEGGITVFLDPIQKEVK